MGTHLRPFCVGAAGAALLLCARPGATEGKSKERRACENAYKAATQLEQSAHLRQAKELLLSCAKSSCGAVLRQRCTVRYTQLESDIPSVVPLVTTETGEPRVDVQVTIDGEPLTPHLDGRALPVDPGLHEFSFAADGAVISTQKVMIVQGQRNRPIAVSLRPSDKHGAKPALGPALPAGGADAKAALDKPATDRPTLEKPEREALPEKAPEKTADKSPDKAVDSSEPEAPPPDAPRSSGPGALPYVIGAAGLAGIGGYGLLVSWGRKDNAALTACAPNCSPESVDHIRKLYLAADISLGVGIAALGAAATWLIVGGGSSPKDEQAKKPRYHVDVRPAPSGAFATVSGTF